MDPFDSILSVIFFIVVLTAYILAKVSIYIFSLFIALFIIFAYFAIGLSILNIFIIAIILGFIAFLVSIVA